MMGVVGCTYGTYVSIKSNEVLELHLKVGLCMCYTNMWDTEFSDTMYAVIVHTYVYVDKYTCFLFLRE